MKYIQLEKFFLLAGDFNDLKTNTFTIFIQKWNVYSMKKLFFFHTHKINIPGFVKTVCWLLRIYIKHRIPFIFTCYFEHKFYSVTLYKDNLHRFFGVMRKYLKIELYKLKIHSVYYDPLFYKWIKMSFYFECFLFYGVVFPSAICKYN